MNDEEEILAFLKAKKAAKQRAAQIVEPKPSDIGETIKTKTGLKKVEPGWLQKSIAEANRKANEPAPTLVYDASKKAWVRPDGTEITDMVGGLVDRMGLIQDEENVLFLKEMYEHYCYSHSEYVEYLTEEEMLASYINHGYDHALMFMETLADNMQDEEDDRFNRDDW